MASLVSGFASAVAAGTKKLGKSLVKIYNKYTNGNGGDAIQKVQDESDEFAKEVSAYKYMFQKSAKIVCPSKWEREHDRDGRLAGARAKFFGDLLRDGYIGEAAKALGLDPSATSAYVDIVRIFAAMLYYMVAEDPVAMSDESTRLTFTIRLATLFGNELKIIGLDTAAIIASDNPFESGPAKIAAAVDQQDQIKDGDASAGLFGSDDDGDDDGIGRDSWKDQVRNLRARQ
jgi:hypothetical protein